MLLAIVSSNSTVSCVTMPICARSDCSVTWRMSRPSIAIAPPRHVEEPRNQVDECGLAGAAAADNCDHLSRRDLERDVPQNRAGCASRRKQSSRCGTQSTDEKGGSACASGSSATSVWVSSISKIRSPAAMACCRFAFTRLSFLAGAYITNMAARNDVNSPGREASGGDLLRCHTTEPPPCRCHRAVPWPAALRDKARTTRMFVR